MKMYKLFSGLCLASAFIAACGKESFPVGVIGGLCLCSVIFGLTGWELMEKTTQTEGQDEVYERRKGARILSRRGS